MKIIVQRVSSAKVTVEGKVTGEIGKGYLALIGVEKTDDKQIAEKYLSKMLKMRIFEDENGKTNLSLDKVGGELLMISQFTLMGNLKGQNRPGFTNAAPPDMASEIYECMVEKARQSVPKVETGVFGADMKVELVNDGPFTIILDETQV